MAPRDPQAFRALPEADPSPTEAAVEATPDEDLLLRWQGGDREAGGRLLAGQHDLVRRTCRRHGIHREDEIAEIYQELVVRLVRSLARLRIERSFAGYCRRATENTIAELRGGRPRPRTGEELPDPPDPKTPGGDPALREAMERCRGRLSALEDAVFEHRYVLGRDYAEIAVLVGRTVNHVGVTIFRLVRKMRECLSGSGYAEEE